VKKAEQLEDASFSICAGERIIEGKTVSVRDRGVTHALHVIIIERTTRTGKKQRHAHIEAPSGVPIPGKGENSWDLDDDAIYGMTSGAKSVKEAVSKFMESVRKTRSER
jgi:hypothetical protein